MNSFLSKNICLVSIALILFQCSGNNNETVSDKAKPSISHTKIVRVISPANNSSFFLGDEVDFNIIARKGFNMDSILIKVNNDIISLDNDKGDTILGKSILPVIKTGKILIKIQSFLNDSLTETDYLEINALSDIEPEQMTYKVLNTFAHSINAYTQGLVYEDGLIYEGTGYWGQSRLLKYKAGTQNALKEIYLPAELFGEGIEIYGNKLIQLTYRAQKAFVYNKNTFEKIGEFNYPYQEGWGITFDGEYLIMSDGSNNLYFLDPELLTEVKRIEVCDNNGIMDSLNELEYIDGFIYANVYQRNFIVCIDPNTGKILKKIDMSNILRPDDYHQNIDVLNGIAFNPERNTYYITGKYWPKMFEVVFVKK